LQSMAWYLNRISRMSLPELSCRAVGIVRNLVEASGVGLVQSPPVPTLCSDSRAWVAGTRGLDAARYCAAAAQILEGSIHVFALRLPSRVTDLNWNTDPLTGCRAPLRFGKVIDYRDENLVGNIKYLWELNRHLDLVTLAEAYALTRDHRYLGGIAVRLGSWLDQCPYLKGVNWCSSLELGIRLINWSIVWQLIGGLESRLFAGAPGADLRKRLIDSIFQHVHFIRSYYSRHSSANNHLVGEAAGVFVASCTWPHWTEFDRWGSEARSVLIESAKTQVHEDGVTREQAIGYQQFVLDFFIIAGLAARARNADFPASYWRTVEKMIEFIYAIMDVAGNVPMIGDADDGRVVRLSQEPGFCPFRSLLATGAVLFHRADFAAKSGGLDDKTRVLVGGDQSAQLFPHSSDAPLAGRRSFPHGGYFVLGSELETPREVRLTADAGPLGFLSIAAHGHSDALSIVLSVAGREILVDPGTFSYHTKGAWREYFRGTSAHNTVRVDRLDQSVQGGNFMWQRHAKARCLDFAHDDTGSRFIGEHDGYTRLADPVVHKRAIRQQGNRIEIMDRIDCAGYHVIERFWHFGEHCHVDISDTRVVAVHGPVRVTFTAGEAVQLVRLRASEDPPGGWVSRRFDVKVPSDSIVWTNEVRSTSELRSLIEWSIG
jgi:Heparinase II/III-like protein/Heparinase II/III N-terminus